MKTIAEIIEAINNTDWNELHTPELRTWLTNLFSEDIMVYSKAHDRLDWFFTGRNESHENYPSLSEIFEFKGSVVGVVYLLDILASDRHKGRFNVLYLLYDIAANIGYQLKDTSEAMENILKVKDMLRDARELFASLTTHPDPKIQEAAKQTIQWLSEDSFNGR